ncbi:ABC transporter substrate-binding protein [Streptomyces longwoodensis]|uniref:ABC transporter substrate-binding protein n=1 Tax=Streptomyces longwoodensis TaxID=68231 RepID=UPI0033DD5792
MKPARLRTTTAAVGVVASLLLASACSSSPNADNGKAGRGSGVLNIGTASGPQTENNNPYLNTSSALGVGYASVTFETLALVNPIRPADKPKPWLATDWAWSPDLRSITLTVRDGVTWSDGKPFSAQDVAFSFGLMKKFPALNGAGVPYKDIKVDGDKVVLGFDAPQFVNESNILSLFVVPQHIWASQADPTTFTNPKPVGTGPYVLDRFAPQSIVLKRRDDYWQKAPRVAELHYTTYNDNTGLTTALASGAVEWGWAPIPDIKGVYLSKDPKHHHGWFPAALGANGLWLNNERGPFKNKALRQAAGLVTDRKLIATEGQYGLVPPIENPTGIPLPAGESFLPPEYKSAKLTVDVDKARKILTGAGYTYRGSTLIDPSGKPVEVTLTDPAGWADYLADLDIIKSGLQKIGVKATIKTQSADSWSQAFNNGDFDATMHWTNGGASPYDMYANIMSGAAYKPVGTSAQNNQGRYRNAEVDAALKAYVTATDTAARTAALAVLQRHMAEDVPAILTHANAIGGEYSTKHWVGWPSETDPYAPPQPVQRTAVDVVLHLRPAT